MTDQELDKECELLKQYMKYYVDVLANNEHVKMNVKNIFRLFNKTGLLLLSYNNSLVKEIPVSFDLWKKTVTI